MFGRIFDIFRERVSPNDGSITVALKGMDLALFLKAKRIIEAEEQQEIQSVSILKEALRLYEHYTLTTKLQKGIYNRRWIGEKGFFPVIDFPSLAHENGMIFRVKFADNSYNDRLQKVADLNNIKTTSAVMQRALIFYSQSIIDEHYGWQHFFFNPDGLDGGQPIFEDDVEQSNSVSVIKIRDYFPREKRVASAHKLEF